MFPRAIVTGLVISLSAAACGDVQDEGDEASLDGTFDDGLSMNAAEANGAAGWQLSLQDEFNGTTLDTHKWATKYVWGAALPPAAQRARVLHGRRSHRGWRPRSASPRRVSK